MKKYLSYLCLILLVISSFYLFYKNLFPVNYIIGIWLGIICFKYLSLFRIVIWCLVSYFVMQVIPPTLPPIIPPQLPPIVPPLVLGVVGLIGLISAYRYPKIWISITLLLLPLCFKSFLPNNPIFYVGTSLFIGAISVLLVHKYYYFLHKIIDVLHNIAGFLIPFGNFYYTQAELNLTMEQIDKLGEGESHSDRGDAFENFVASVWRELGYKAHTVAELKAQGIYPKSVNPNKRADKGLDVVVWRTNSLGKPYVYFIQCKLYKNQLTSDVIYECRKAENNWKECFPNLPIKKAVWTNSYFTEDALEEASHESCECIDRDGLSNFLQKNLKNGKMLKTGKNSNE